MSQSEKSFYYGALQRAGVPFSKHYREYKTKELAEAYDQLFPDGPAYVPDAVASSPAAERAEARERLGHEISPVPPIAPRNPDEMAGERQHVGELEPIRTDPETGFVWFQEEVQKPAFPKSRGRRVLRYDDPGVQTQTVTNGQYTETFEVAGDPRQARPAEIKITLPSYQVGIYQDPRLPFKIHTYGGRNGFSLDDVLNYYGGADLVPSEIKRVYVENDLCYDVRTTIRAIESEYRRLQLAGKVT